MLRKDVCARETRTPDLSLAGEGTVSCNAASSAPDRTRTCDHPLNGRVLYQLSYQSMVPVFPGSHLFLRSDRVAYSDQPIGCRKHELPYSCAPFRNEHDNGLEPIIPVWKTGVLPITPIVRVWVGTGVEPALPCRLKAAALRCPSIGNNFHIHCSQLVLHRLLRYL